MIIKKFFKDIFFYGASGVIAKILPILSLPILTRKLTVTQFGVVDSLSGLLTFVPLVIGLGYDIALKREIVFYTKETNELPFDLLKTILVFLSVWGLFIVLCMVLYADDASNLILNSPEFSIPYIMAVVSIYVSVFLNFVLTIKKAIFKVRDFSLLTIINSVLNYGTILFLVFLWDDSIMAYFTALAASNTVITLVALKKNKKYYDGKFKFALLFQMLKYGFPAMVSGVAYWVFNYTDRIFLNKMAGIQETGYYSMSLKVVSIFVFIIGIFHKAWTPRAFELYRDNPDGFSKILSKAMLWGSIAFSMIALGTNAAAEIMVFVFSTKDYVNSIPVVAPLAFAYIFYALSYFSSIGIYISGKTSSLTLITWISAGINVIVNILLIPALGAFAAALSTLISYMFIFISYDIVSNKSMKWKIKIGLPMAILLIAFVMFVLMRFVNLGSVILNLIARLSLVLLFFFLLVCLKIVSMNEIHYLLNLMQESFHNLRRKVGY